MKVLGLTMIYGYAFFKFAWSYRLFNYTAILIGATPQPDTSEPVRRARAGHKAGLMHIEAGRQFNRGQRALFFSFAYLGWFISPYVFVFTTAWIFYIVSHRQFSSSARVAATADDIEFIP
jgi:uncharacterized membrane protein